MAVTPSPIYPAETTLPSIHNNTVRPRRIFRVPRGVGSNFTSEKNEQNYGYHIIIKKTVS
jgi:hypothetical protein